MNIDELTIAQARQIAAMFANAGKAPSASKHVGKICLIRTYASGVHAGMLDRHEGQLVELSNARRLWRWRAAEGISLSEVATVGIVAANSRICAVVPKMTILDALEIIPLSNVAEASIMEALVAQP